MAVRIAPSLGAKNTGSDFEIRTASITLRAPRVTGDVIKAEDRDPGHRPDEAWPVKVWASATHTPPRPCGQSALRLGSLGACPGHNLSVGCASSAADRMHQQTCCAEFPFPRCQKVPPDRGGK